MKTINGTVNFPHTLNCALTRALMVAGFLLGAANGFPQALLITQSPQNDSIVRLAADEAGLAQVAPADLPSGGTYYWILAGGGALPMPLPPQDGSPIYQVTPNVFIADQTGGQIITGPHRPGTQAANVSLASVAASQADSVMSLINKIQTTAATQQTRSMARAMGMGVPSPGDGGDGGSGDAGGGGSYTNNYVVYTFDHSLLWLEITNVWNGWAYLNLHNSTNQIYAIWSTTNLLTPFAGWNVETEVWPTDTNCMPFTVATLGRTNLFLRAEDWTGAMQNGLYCWWTWLYFGNLNESASNWDSQGNTLGYDYTNSIDPNIISFTVSATNTYFNQSSVPLQINVSGGVPSFYAVLVNDTNLADAYWQNYVGTNLSAMLGSTDGVYAVSVGLRGLPQIAKQTWQTVQLTKDTVAPTLVITNPTVNITAQPMIQLQGYSIKSLSAVSFDISNALGVVSNQTGFVQAQYLDPALFVFTTNWFQCYDLDLTNGVNTITLRATDWAGNITTTNFNITLDYSVATNPVVQIIWPPDGGQISAASFTCRGTLDDPTAAVTAQITDTNGNVSVAIGEVERNGNFWVEDLPLSSGPNVLTLAVTNAAGMGIVTSLTLAQAAQTLSMNAVPPEQLWQPSLSVSGVVSDTSCAISVNGVPGVNNGDNTWFATNVPVAAGGMACFDLTATPAQSSQFQSFANTPNQSNPNAFINNTNIERPAQIVVSAYTNGWTSSFTPATGGGNGPQPNLVIVPNAYREQYQLIWHEDIGTTASDTVSNLNGICTKNYVWPADEYILNVSSPSQNGTETSTCSTNVAQVGPPAIALEHCNVATNGSSSVGTTKYTRKAQTVLTLVTGGKGLSHHKNLFQISGSAMAITNLVTGMGSPVTEYYIQIGDLGKLDTESNLWCALPDNDAKDITPTVAGLVPDDYTFTASQQKFPVIHNTVCPALTDANLNRTNIGVGEEVDLRFATSDLLTQTANWATSLGQFCGVQMSSPVVAVFTAPDTAQQVTVTPSVHGVELPPITFNVKEPSGFDPIHTHIVSTYTNDPLYTVNQSEAEMHIYVYMRPTDVSFYKVWMMEVGEDATNITDYFTDTNLFTTNPSVALSHKGGFYTSKADYPFRLDSNNLWDTNWDTCSSGPLPVNSTGNWSPGGSFTWNVPWKWGIGMANITHLMTNSWQQVFKVDANGKVTITKFNKITVTRDTNNVVVPSL
jgi:hypothetical protein